MHQFISDFYTVGEMLGHTLAEIGASLGISMNFEAVTAWYVDVRLERKKEVLNSYYATIHPHPKQPDEQKGGALKGVTRTAEKKHRNRAVNS